MLDHALHGAAGGPACERFVEELGLKSLFPAYMQPMAARGMHWQDMEHVLGIFASLLHNLASESTLRVRFLVKFVEADYAKTDRLLELRDGAVARVHVAERGAAAERSTLLDEGTSEVDADALLYLRRLESGLYALQLIDYVLAWLVMEDDGVQAHAARMLQRRGLTFADVVRVLREYGDNVGEATAASGDRLAEIVAALLDYVEALPADRS